MMCPAASNMVKVQQKLAHALEVVCELIQVSISDTCVNDAGEFDLGEVSRMLDNRIAVKSAGVNMM
eukprot:1261280-Heterocapsa_arctica.AAC.1